MGIFKNMFEKPGAGIPKDAPKKKGPALFISILGREWWELLKLNFLYLLFCIPLITIPAATTAMSRITLTMAADKNHFLWDDFRKSFRDDFRKSTIAGILYFVLFVAGCYGAYFYGLAAKQADNLFAYLLAGLCILIAVIVIASSYYAFPMIALIDLPLGKILHNSFLLSNICLGYTIIALFLHGIFALLVVIFFPFSILPILVFLPVLMNFISTFCANHAIQKYIVKPAPDL